jgi:hypothetical protein
VHLSSHDLLVEVSFALLNALGEAFVLGFVNLALDHISLALCRGLGFLLLGACLAALVSSQVAAEFGLSAAAVVEPNGVGCK